MMTFLQGHHEYLPNKGWKSPNCMMKPKNNGADVHPELAEIMLASSEEFRDSKNQNNLLSSIEPLWAASA
jgi:hypothetical protein